MISNLDYKTGDIELPVEQWKAITLRAADTTRISLSQLNSAMNELKEETTIHRFFHIHHTTILYVFISWIVFCFLAMWFRGRNSGQPNITVNN